MQTPKIDSIFNSLEAMQDCKLKNLIRSSESEGKETNILVGTLKELRGSTYLPFSVVLFITCHPEMPIFIIYSSTLKIFESFSNLFLYGTICLCFCSGSFSYDDYTVQEGRGIVFPVFTVLQFAVGITVPTQVPNRTVVTNWGVLSNLPLPSKINQLYPYTVKGRQLTHDNLYEFLTTAWNWGTSDGKQCMLKTICQVSNMNSNNGELIFDVLRLLFSPSSLKYPIARTHYMIAEQRGKTPRSSSCAEMYPSCSHSIIDLLVLK